MKLFRRLLLRFRICRRCGTFLVTDLDPPSIEDPSVHQMCP